MRQEMSGLVGKIIELLFGVLVLFDPAQRGCHPCGPADEMGDLLHTRENGRKNLDA